MTASSVSRMSASGDQMPETAGAMPAASRNRPIRSKTVIDLGCDGLSPAQRGERPFQKPSRPVMYGQGHRGSPPRNDDCQDYFHAARRRCADPVGGPVSPRQGPFGPLRVSRIEGRLDDE